MDHASAMLLRFADIPQTLSSGSSALVTNTAGLVSDVYVSLVLTTTSIAAFESLLQPEMTMTTQPTNSLAAGRRLQASCLAVNVTHPATVMLVSHLTNNLIPAIPVLVGHGGLSVGDALAAICPSLPQAHLFSVDVRVNAQLSIPCEPGDASCASTYQARVPTGVVTNFYPPSPPAPPSLPPSPSPPSPPPPSQPPSPWPSPPPPLASLCGCQHFLDGLSIASHAEDVCAKSEAHLGRVCRPKGNSRQCPSDMAPCLSTCVDAPDRWAMRKCARKAGKGKCRKRRVAWLCRATCGRCVTRQ